VYLNWVQIVQDREIVSYQVFLVDKKERTWKKFQGGKGDLDAYFPSWEPLEHEARCRGKSVGTNNRGRIIFRKLDEKGGKVGTKKGSRLPPLTSKRDHVVRGRTSP